MMKCGLALVVLLHFCSSFTLNRDLNGEIIKRLNELKKLYSHNKVSFTSQDPIRTPPSGSKHLKNASSCVHIYARELMRFLNNATADDDNGQDIINGLMLNLNKLDLEPNRTNPEIKCPMNGSTSAPFNLYRTFFMRLNRSKRR